MKKTILFLFAAAIAANIAKAQTGNQGLNFDGNDDHVTVPNNPAYNVGTGNFTIEAWVKLSTTSNALYPTIVSTRETGNVNSGLLFFLYSGRVMMQIAGSNLGQGNVNIKDNICHHVAVTRTGTVINYYIDGNLDATFSSGGNISSTHSLWIGNDEPSAAYSPFKGLIHEVRYWNIARTQSQIQSTKNVFLAGNENGLIGYWRMNDGSGQIVNDLTSINNDGYLGTVNTADNADPVYQPGCLCPSTITAGGPVGFCTGGNVVLTVSSGTGLTYQWQLNGANISGATSISYTAASAGNYTCIVTGTCGAVTSNTITVTVYSSAPAAVITAGGSTTFCSGGSVTLNANTGAGLSYQWKNNGTNISGETNSSYTAAASGSYTVAVTNACGSATSSAVNVTVNPQPTASITPAGATTFCSGGSVLLNANTGTGLTYQWKNNGTNISGATNSSYTTNSSGSYTVVVTSSNNCSNTSSATIVTVNSLPQISITSSNPGFCSGAASILSASTSPSGNSLQWYFNSSSISGATSSTYTASQGGAYYCRATSSCGTANSNEFNYYGNSLPSPVITPSGIIENCSGSYPINLSVSPASDVSYSSSHNWWRNNQPIGSSGTFPFISVSSPGDYYAIVQYSCGQSQSNNLNLKVLPAPSIPVEHSNVTWGCTGTGIYVAVNYFWNSYQWQKNGIDVPGANSAQYYPSSSGYYRCRISNSCAFQYSDSSFIDIIPAYITPSGPTTYCYGNPITLNGPTPPAGSAYNYSWHRSGIGWVSSNQSVSTSNLLPGTYTYTLTVTASYGCICCQPSASVVVTVLNATANITPGGATTFCNGGSVILNANTGTGLTYQWKNGGTNISGATNSSYTATTSGSYTVVVTNTCGSATSTAVTVTVNPLPTVSFSGLAASYNVSAPAATLTGSPSGGTFSGPGISGNTFTPSVAGVGGPYTIVYSYTDGNGCSNSSSQQTTVTNCTVPAQPGTITVTGGIAKVCPGDSRTYTIAAVSGATSYTWTPPTGASITSGQGNTSVIINYTAGFTVSGTLSVVANNACGSSLAKTLTISRNNPSTPGVISGAASGVCAGTTGAYSVVNVAGITYNWTAPANASIASGQGTNSVTVSFSASFTTGTLKVTAGNNCGTSGARTLSILSKPATPSVISGASNTVCAGTTGTYTVTNVSGVTYNWTAPANASIASGQGTNSVSVSFSALFTSGSLKVSGSNACGTSALRTLSISSKPAQPGTITGPGYGNCNATATYSIVAVAYATSYTWTTNIAGAVVTPNGTSASISFPAFTSGTVSVTANNVCGSSTARTLTVKGTPATPASITGPAMVCANQFGVPYSIAAIPTATSYTWTGMTGSHISDGVVTSGGTTLTTTSTSVTINFGSTSGNLNVKANNACGAGTNKTLTIGFNCREDEVVTEDNFDVKVFPNPSSGDFVFEIANAGNEKITINIYDVIGKLVLSEAIHHSQFTIRRPQLTTGIYSAEIICGENKKVMRLVKTE